MTTSPFVFNLDKGLKISTGIYVGLTLNWLIYDYLFLSWEWNPIFYEISDSWLNTPLDAEIKIPGYHFIYQRLSVVHKRIDGIRNYLLPGFKYNHLDYLNVNCLGFWSLIDFLFCSIMMCT